MIVEEPLRLLGRIVERERRAQAGQSARMVVRQRQFSLSGLSEATHRIRFVYTPKHTSWLNPIEVWFSILNKHVLRRGNFTSKEDLGAKIQRYIAYYNQHFAKVWKWSAVKTKEIEALITKVMRIEGALPPSEGEKVVAYL